MAEAMALLGVISAGIQCTQAGLQVLLLGSSLRSKFQDAPEKVKGWLSQIEHLVSLTELARETSADISSSSTPPLQPSFSPPPDPAVTQVESVLQECTHQCKTLQDTLKTMLQDVDDGKGQQIWKRILTVKRETRILSALEEIERQKGMLNIWLGQKSLRQLNRLHQVVGGVREGVDKVDYRLLHTEQTLQSEFQNLSTEINSTSAITASGFESLKTINTSNFQLIGQQIQQHRNEFRSDLQSESLVIKSQLDDLAKEMKAWKHEARKLAKKRAQIARSPSLLKEALDQQKSSLDFESTRIFRQKGMKKYRSISPEICSCYGSNRSQSLTFGKCAQIQLTYRTIHQRNCPAYASPSPNYFAAIRCYAQSNMLRNLVKISFEAVCGAGGSSLGISLSTSRRIQYHPLFSLLSSVYDDDYPTNSTLHKLHDEKSQEALVKVVQKELLCTFNSGIASPYDVDSFGRNLIHLQFDYFPGTTDGQRMLAKIVKLLISMGVSTNDTNDDLLTPLHQVQRRFTLESSFLYDFLRSDNLEWNGLSQKRTVNGSEIIEYMRRWPESKYGILKIGLSLSLVSKDILEIFLANFKVTKFQFRANISPFSDWGYPYISDILLRKSKADLQLFIDRGMKPVESGYRCLTPLHLAAAADWPEAVALLVAGGADIYAQDADLFLPVDFAIKTNCVKAVDILLDGDCVPQFTTPRVGKEVGTTTIPNAFWDGIFHNESIRDAILRALIRLQDDLKDLLLYHELIVESSFIPEDSTEGGIAFAEDLFAGGFRDLESRDKRGMTPLMLACAEPHIRMVNFLLEKGADPSTAHRELGLTAGYFLACQVDLDNWLYYSDAKSYGNLLQKAFDIVDTIESYCRCSPEGFSPLAASYRQYHRGIHSHNRSKFFRDCMSCLQWPISLIEQQARAFARCEIFHRLEMTHTCIDLRRIPEEDRLEIEEEEDEFYDQLQQLMGEYDSCRVEFNGGPLDFLDFFFKDIELELPSRDSSRFSRLDQDGKDLLGPRDRYQFLRYSFTGKEIYHNHRETVVEENMLSLLFG